MISIPFSYPKDKNLKLLVQFDNWFSRQKNFTIRQDSSIVEESEVVEDVFVAQAGEKYYAIRFEQNFLTPTLYIDKEPFVLGEKLKWHDYLLITLVNFFILIFPPLFLNIHPNIGIFIWPFLYFMARYISLSESPLKRKFMWVVSILTISFELYLKFLP